jgi:hypothetical protein
MSVEDCPFCGTQSLKGKTLLPDIVTVLARNSVKVHATVPKDGRYVKRTVAVRVLRLRTRESTMISHRQRLFFSYQEYNNGI